MARIGVGNKYNLAINGLGYLVRGLNYKKKDARTFSPRFGTGEMGETDLDTWKVLTQNDFSGGSFQESLEDITKVSLLDGLIRSNYDKFLYRAPSVKTCNAGANMKSAEFGSIEYKGETYVIQNNSATGAIYKLSAGVWTAVKTDFATKLVALAICKGKLVVGAYTGGTYTYDGTTWVNTAGLTPLKCMVPFNGKIYTDGSNNSLYSWDLTTGGGVTLIGEVGDTLLAPSAYRVFNHRLYIGKPDGLYCYDGVQISCVLDYSNAVNVNNFRTMSVFNGSLYTTIGNILYKFNGSSLEEIMDFTTFEDITSIFTFQNRLWLLTAARAVSNWGGKDGSSLISGTVNLYRFDGQGWAKVHNAALSASGVGLGGQGSNLVIFTYVDGTTANTHFYYPIGSEFNTITNSTTDGAVRQGDLISSVFDAGFSNIDKTLESIEVDTVGMTIGDVVTVSYRIYNGFTWTNWASLGSITTLTPNRINVHDVLPAGVIFKKIQVKVSTAAGYTNGLCMRGYSIKYIIDPVYKREWQVSLLAVGTSEAPLDLLDGSQETNLASILRDNIYDARIDPNPVAFEDIDYTILNGAVAANNVGIDELDQQQIVVTNSEMNNTSGGGGQIAQSFVAAKTGTLHKVKLPLAHNGYGGDTETYIAIRTDNADTPSNTAVGVTATITAPEHNLSWVDAVVNAPIVAGTKYWIVVYTSGPSGRGVAWFGGVTAGDYASGKAVYNPAGSWIAAPTVKDFAFKTYVSDGRADNFNAVTVDTTRLFPDSGFIKIDDEVIEYASKDATHFLGCTRASLGTTAAVHADNSVVNLYFRVILSDILNEEVYWPVDPLIEATPVLNNPETILTVVLKEA